MPTFAYTVSPVSGVVAAGGSSDIQPVIGTNPFVFDLTVTSVDSVVSSVTAGNSSVSYISLAQQNSTVVRVTRDPVTSVFDELYRVVSFTDDPAGVVSELTPEELDTAPEGQSVFTWEFPSQSVIRVSYGLTVNYVGTPVPPANVGVSGSANVAPTHDLVWDWEPALVRFADAVGDSER